MPLEITRLHLASLQGLDGRRWPVHGFVITHPGGAVLVDTGVGGPQDALDDWRVVNRSVADALAELDMTPADIGLVINTHLHFDHCGQNAVFRHAPHYVQRAELARAEREAPELCGWFDFMNARWELLDGDTEVLPGLEVVATPGHTAGPPVRGGARRRRHVRPADRRRRLHAAALRRRGHGRRATPARPGQRRPGLARHGAADPLAAPATASTSATTPTSSTAREQRAHHRGGRDLHAAGQRRAQPLDLAVRQRRPERGHVLDPRGRPGRPDPAHRGRDLRRAIRPRHAGDGLGDRARSARAPWCSFRRWRRTGSPRSSRTWPWWSSSPRRTDRAARAEVPRVTPFIPNERWFPPRQLPSLASASARSLPASPA